MILTILIVLAALWLAYGNGANDNFKGVATLYGSNTTTYKGALWWATATTFAGSVVSVALARKLIVTFSGKGLVPNELAGSPAFAVAVGLGAAVTIFVATYIGMPTSTTHALIGGLLGTGLAARVSINTGVLLTKFAIPMLTSPVLAIAIAALLYSLFITLQKAMLPKEATLALEAHQSSAHGQSAEASDGLQKSLDTMHYLSAGAVCFSRAVNDTPKIAALLLTTAVLPTAIGVGLIGIAIALGGIIQSRQVAETMSKRITRLSPDQGFTANITTAGLVLFASNLGVPVSTTHVSCGAIFGIGAVNRTGKWETISKILATWATTLPLAALISGGLYLGLRSLV